MKSAAARCTVRPFTGANIALLFWDRVLLYQRDNSPNLPYANLWDFPGGRRDGMESPVACVVRETFEEVSIRLDPAAIRYQSVGPSVRIVDGRTYFMAAHLTHQQVDGIKLGAEGQRWELMPIVEALTRTDVVPHLQMRFEVCINSLAATHGRAGGNWAREELARKLRALA
jgi:8-oxo-dGTP diphosphatase